jgi:glutamine---fructose-6-phosphate transaminase (isomerizing)
MPEGTVYDMTLIDEIREQPESLERAIRENVGVFADVARAVSGCSHVVIAARGTSDNAARYAQYVWGIRNELSVSLTTPSLFSIYRRPPSLAGAFVVGISQSGQSPDIVSVLEESRRQGRPTTAITNDPHSPLATAADIVVPLNSGPELAVAATKTYTAQLAVIGAISEAITKGQAGVSGLPDLAAAALSADDEARTAAGLLAGVEHAAVLGRGFNLATAFEWALKMQELSYVVAQPFSTADFSHGPVAVVDKGYPVMAVVADGPTAEDVLAAVDRAAQRGAPTVLLTNIDVEKDSSAIRFPTAPEWLTPIPAIVAAQLFTYHLTVAQGNDPDSPRGLSKVTRTT